MNIRGIRHERYCDEFSTVMMCNNLFGNTARKLGISNEMVKSTPNACTNRVRIICDYCIKKALSMLPGYQFQNEQCS